MRKIILTAICIILGMPTLAFYDFCESPQDYNTCKDAYDVRTEYWTDIPNYHPNDIKIKEKNSKQKSNKLIIKKKPETQETEIKTDNPSVLLDE